MNKNIYVTQPLLPNLENLEKELSEIWASKIVTNAGVKHNLLEEKLKEHLGVPNVSLFNNGTLALLTALKALDLPLGSEVITTYVGIVIMVYAISNIIDTIIFKKNVNEIVKLLK